MLKAILASFAKPILSKVHRYKDAHKGESCYLMGDGVSIKWFDLGAFSDKITIPCNFIPFHNDFHKLSVPYVCHTEPWWFYPLERDPATIGKLKPNPRQAVYREIIDGNKDKVFFLNLSNYPVIRRKNVVYTFRDFNDSRLESDFITNRVNAFSGSLRSSISLAIYMGFSHIYLVGYDYTHHPSRSLHWYEKGPGLFVPQEDYNKDFFKIAQEFVDITTITLDGKSEFINYSSYHDFTGNAPNFKENTSLASSRYLNVLDTWSGYDIFD